MPDAGQTRAYLALTLIATLWGSYPAFAKLALAHFPPYVLVALRCVLASAFLTVLLFRRGWDEFRELRPADLRTFAFLGFVGLFVSTGGTYLGIALSTTPRSAAPRTPKVALRTIGRQSPPSDERGHGGRLRPCSTPVSIRSTSPTPPRPSASAGAVER